MTKNIHFFSEKEFVKKEDVLERIGVRGRLAMELAALKLPILPGFVIDADVASDLEDVSLKTHLKKAFAKLETIRGRVFGDPQNPMLVKIVISPNIVIATSPTLHNYGLTDETIEGFSHFVGPKFSYHEALFLIRGTLAIEERIAEFEGREKDLAKIQAALKELEKDSEMSVDRMRESIDRYKALLPKGFFEEPYGQIEIAIKRISRMLRLDELDDRDTALLIQPMVYGNYGKDSSSGMFFTRNINTGEKKLQGEFFQDKFDSWGTPGKDINKIAPAYLKKLEGIARTVEDYYKEIRSMRFTIENKNLWFIDQRAVMAKSTQSDIKTLLDLHGRKIVDEKYLIKTIKPNQLVEVLHPVVNLDSVKSLKTITGGISGAPGAAVGRIFFTTDGLLEAYRLAQQQDTDTRLILCMEATFAEDVKAIEVASGVLSTEGGYSAHASVVARQYGKISLVNPDLRIQGKKATVDGITIKEGDYLTLNVPNHGEPAIYLGQAELIEPNPEESGLMDFLQIIKRHVHEFNARANADSPRDAALALKFGAEGIGLCRTEHMFFQEKRINVFREMILADSKEERIKALNKLKPIQKVDFYKIFKIMEGRPVTIRLLDAPLHEFLPHNDDEMDGFINYLNKGKTKGKLSKREVQFRCEALEEFNPMLGHRGCRIAVSYPEIYEMQVNAIFEAVYTLRKEGIPVHPEIMIPLIMNADELKLIVYGKRIEGQHIKGLIEVEEEVRKRMKAQPVPFKIGTMIELPVAALGAGEIARYAEFFSFGTNDLTQTTIGLSRDDFNGFMPDYTLFDLLEGNPFQFLNTHVKELVAAAVKRGSMTRPNIKLGLCGEHGAVPENIQFCMETGLNYVSCSAYSLPVANLAIAQFNLGGDGAAS
jgi:pyruvate,orthophosphate dikinase